MPDLELDPSNPIQGETAKAYAAFCKYRDMHPTERRLGASKAVRARTVVREWSSKFHWVARAAAWDVESAKRHSEKLRRYREVQDAKHLKTLAIQRDQIADGIAKNKTLQKDSPVSMLNAADAGKAYDQVVKTQRLVMGEATEITESKTKPSQDFTKLNPQERLEYARLQDKLNRA